MGVSIIHDNDVRGALVTDAHERFVYTEFRDMINAHATATPMGDPTGTAGNVNTLHVGPHTFQYHIIGTQTILAPKRVATGLDVTLDLADNDGLEYTLGCEDPADTVVSALGRGTFTVGTDPAFGFSLKLSQADVSGEDEMLVGFRKSEAYQAVIETGYDEMAAFNNESGDIKISTTLNGTNTVTDTTQNWADAATHTLTIWCDSLGDLRGTRGKVYFEIDGDTPTTTKAFTFDNAEVVMPFFAFRHDTTTPGAIILKKWMSGYVGVSELDQLAG